MSIKEYIIKAVIESSDEDSLLISVFVSGMQAKKRITEEQKETQQNENTPTPDK